MSEETQPLEITDDILIPCPLVQFASRLAQHCLSCEHYKGMAQKTVDGKPLAEKDVVAGYMVICGKPITRNMQRFIRE